jgi:hypothetical protein
MLLFRSRYLLFSIALAIVSTFALFFGFWYARAALVRDLTAEGNYQFLENLLAGGLGTIVEVFAISVIVNAIGERRDRNQWRYMRSRLLELIARKIHLMRYELSNIGFTKIIRTNLRNLIPNDVLQLLKNNFSEASAGPTSVKNCIHEVRNEFDRFSLCINSEIAEFVVRLDEIASTRIDYINEDSENHSIQYMDVQSAIFGLEQAQFCIQFANELKDLFCVSLVKVAGFIDVKAEYEKIISAQDFRLAILNDAITECLKEIERTNKIEKGAFCHFYKKYRILIK